MKIYKMLNVGNLRGKEEIRKTMGIEKTGTIGKI